MRTVVVSDGGKYQHCLSTRLGWVMAGLVLWAIEEKLGFVDWYHEGFVVGIVVGGEFTAGAGCWGASGKFRHGWVG